jgi:hypothetical protein
MSARTPAIPRLFGALHPDALPELRRVTVATPRTVTGMGTLLELELGDLDDPDRVRLWRFAHPLPRLGFEHVSPSAAKGARISRLWMLGGVFHVDAQGHFHGGGVRPAARVKPLSSQHAPRETLQRYEATHGGHAPREQVTGALDLEHGMIPVGWLRAISYHTDKAERAAVDPADYRHAFEGIARPLVCVTADGRGLAVLSDRDVGAVRYGDHRAARFGRYTVTPHGIEDIED